MELGADGIVHRVLGRGTARAPRGPRTARASPPPSRGARPSAARGARGPSGRSRDGEPGEAPRRAPRREDVVRPGDVVAERRGRGRAHEDRAREGGEHTREVLGSGTEELDVLRRHLAARRRPRRDRPEDERGAGAFQGTARSRRRSYSSAASRAASSFVTAFTSLAEFVKRRQRAPGRARPAREGRRRRARGRRPPPRGSAPRTGPPGGRPRRGRDEVLGGRDEAVPGAHDLRAAEEAEPRDPVRAPARRTRSRPSSRAAQRSSGLPATPAAASRPRPGHAGDPRRNRAHEEGRRIEREAAGDVDADGAEREGLLAEADAWRSVEEKPFGTCLGWSATRRAASRNARRKSREISLRPRGGPSPAEVDEEARPRERGRRRGASYAAERGLLLSRARP